MSFLEAGKEEGGLAARVGGGQISGVGRMEWTEGEGGEEERWELTSNFLSNEWYT